MIPLSWTPNIQTDTGIRAVIIGGLGPVPGINVFREAKRYAIREGRVILRSMLGKNEERVVGEAGGVSELCAVPLFDDLWSLDSTASSESTSGSSSSSHSSPSSS